MKNSAGVVGGLMMLGGVSSATLDVSGMTGSHLHAISVFTPEHRVLDVDLQAGAALSISLC